MLKVHEFRFLTTKDTSDTRRQFWSRAYEYERILSKIVSIEPKSTHNTACGLGQVHIDFANRVHALFDNVDNSDNEARPEGDARPNSFYKYDLLDKNNKEYDCVLNISTLEHLGTDNTKKAFWNLYEQTKEGGHMLFTFDRPDVDVSMFEEMLNTECKKEGDILNGSNSVCKQDCRKDLNVVVLHIQK